MAVAFEASVSDNVGGGELVRFFRNGLLSNVLQVVLSFQLALSL